LSHYVLALQEVEKARLEYRRRNAHRDREPLPDRQYPPSEPDCHVERMPRRRLRCVR
jgi:hypothetical protein